VGREYNVLLAAYRTYCPRLNGNPVDQSATCVPTNELVEGSRSQIDGPRPTRRGSTGRESEANSRYAETARLVLGQSARTTNHHC